MISFPRLGNYGRLGNQLFQYAYLRSAATRLGTQFYCPPWDGDAIFDLGDASDRASTPLGIKHRFDPKPEAGFDSSALQIIDDTEVVGFFQSEKYYPHPGAVRRWYSFKPSIQSTVESLYDTAELSKATSISLRIDNDYASTREFFPMYPWTFYARALSIAQPAGPVIVFSDRPDKALEFLRKLRGYDLRVVSDLDGPQQLYMMGQCHTNIITNSTFAWWGAWLNRQPVHRVIAPSQWCRKGVPNAISDILCESWLRVPGTTPLWDDFQIWRIRHPIATIRRVAARLRSTT